MRKPRKSPWICPVAASAVPFFFSVFRFQAAAATALPKDDVVFQAMKDEMDRTMRKIQLSDLPKPYFLSYAVQDGAEVSAEGNFGGLMESSAWPFRHVKVALRVGSYELDNTGFIGRARECRPVMGDLPADDDYDALRFGLWSLTDQAYKQALECYSAKKAYLATKAIKREEADFSHEKPYSYFDPAVLERVDMEAWAGRVQELSALFRKYPSIQNSSVYLSAMPRKVRYLNSEGSSYVRNASLWEVGTIAKVQAADGFALSDSRVFYGHSSKELPAFESLRGEIEKFAKEMSSWVQASTMDAYVGPVLFEDQAAGEFFHHLLADQVSFPRAPLQEDEDRKSFDSGALTGRLNARVAAPLLSAVDDPRREYYNGEPLFGRYIADDEGVPASSVQILEKGRLLDVPMGRTPTAKRAHSNGHGRGGLYATPVGRTGNLVVRSETTMTKWELEKRLRVLARDQGLENYGILVKRIDPEERRDGPLLPAPLAVYKVYVRGGREEPIRGLQFTNLTLRALKDVLAASENMYVLNFYDRGPYRDNMDYVPTSIVAPSVLVQEVELKPTEAKPAKLPYLPHPYFDATKP